MNNVQFTSKEQVIFFMMTPSISLSHYDYKFISNMQYLTHDKKQITSGQSELFEKLLLKYKKQWATNGYDSDQLNMLPWKCVVVTSLPKYTNANVDWDDSINKLIIRVPFKKDFISSFRKEMTSYYPVNDSIDNSLTWSWNSERKRYEANPTTHALKLAYEILPRFFTTVYHNEVKDIITELESNKIEYKSPTLTTVEGKYTVVESNYILDEKLLGVTLDNTPKCLYLMSQLGIDVDSKITNGEAKLEFCSNYIVECDIENVDEWTSWIVELGVKIISMGRGSTQGNMALEALRRALTETKQVFVKNNLLMKLQGELDYTIDDQFIEDLIAKNSLPILVQYNSIVEPDHCHGDNRNGKIIIITNGRTVTVT